MPPPTPHAHSRGEPVPDSNPSGNDAQGWLWKKCGVFSLWRRKYFVLCGPLLSFYDTLPDTCSTNPSIGLSSGTCSSPQGVLRVVYVESTSKGFKVFGSSGKVIHVRANTSSTNFKWVQVCQRAAMLMQQQKETPSPSDCSSTCTVLSDHDTLSRMSDSVDRSGWLRGDNGIKFFVLQATMLTMYENKQPWCVPSYRGYICSVAKKGYQDLRVSLSGGKVLNLQAPTSQDRDDWAMRLYQSTQR
ncbi:hypothetical protein DYB36_005085 [Aphanomyces astaci]|uniref:PH domain-containing protein n=1 Tax=Aphanomyces astaci TaxID=112090 RepID=A0A397B6Y9_APHAT|nr:hypothetical protein DYB36_005085 [Aphanomyces astaci]